MLWEVPSTSLVHITNHSAPLCDSGHNSRPFLRKLHSVAIVAFLALLILNNVPVESVRRDIRADDRALAALGTSQVWNVFAPDPQQVVPATRVDFRYRDGSRSSWRVGRGAPWLAPYRDYRWLKLAENAARDERAVFGLLAYAVRERAEAKPLANAMLVRSVYDVAPAGQDRDAHGRSEEGVLASVEAG